MTIQGQFNIERKSSVCLKLRAAKRNVCDGTTKVIGCVIDIMTDISWNLISGRRKNIQVKDTQKKKTNK